MDLAYSISPVCWFAKALNAKWPSKLYSRATSPHYGIFWSSQDRSRQSIGDEAFMWRQIFLFLSIMDHFFFPPLS